MAPEPLPGGKVHVLKEMAGMERIMRGASTPAEPVGNQSAQLALSLYHHVSL